MLRVLFRYFNDWGDPHAAGSYFLYSHVAGATNLGPFGSCIVLEQLIGSFLVHYFGICLFRHLFVLLEA